MPASRSPVTPNTWPATHTPRVVMLLVGGTSEAPLRVALATTHLPLKDVPAALTRSGLRETLAVVAAELRTKFGIKAPRIAVCGLNPHAGEGGHLGREEIDVIAPAIADVGRENLAEFTGPVAADTVFVPEHAGRYDTVVAMYHDQGLPVLKAASLARESTSPSACRFRARRSITEQRSISRATRRLRKPRTLEALSLRSTSRSSSCSAPLTRQRLIEPREARLGRCALFARTLNLRSKLTLVRLGTALWHNRWSG